MTSQHFPYRLDKRWAPLFLALGVGDDDGVDISDDGLTFGTNHHKGLWIAFVDKIPRVIGFRDHSLLWVSVADPEALAEAIGK
jgi:hypothetical protein